MPDFGSTFSEHFELVYRLVFRLGVPPAEVEDVVARVFAGAQGQPVDQAPRSVERWLRLMTVNAVASHRRWRIFRGTTAGAPEIHPTSLDAQEQVAAVLGEMPRELCEVLVLSEIEELGPKEVGDTLGLSLETVQTRKRVARERFETIWRQLHGKKAKR